MVGGEPSLKISGPYFLHFESEVIFKDILELVTQLIHQSIGQSVTITMVF